FFQAEDGIRDPLVTGVQTCALPISKLREKLLAIILREFHGLLASYRCLTSKTQKEGSSCFSLLIAGPVNNYRIHVGERGRSLRTDRKSTRLNSSHEWISYAVFCLKK